MERYNPDRSQDVALHLHEVVTFPAPDVFNAPVASEGNQNPCESTDSDAQTEHVPGILSEARKPFNGDGDLFTNVRAVFDKHLERLERLKAGLSKAAQTGEMETDGKGMPQRSPERRPRAAPPSYLLAETLRYLDRLEHPPLLPAPRTQSFEDAFKRHEPVFHTVFYRKYAPVIREDAKQEGLLALFRKWRKDPTILDQSPAYVVNAAIYGVSNWRKKGMKLRGRQLPLLVDNQGKVAGEPRAHAHERWTDRIDLRLDVANAVGVVLYQYGKQPEYKAVHRVIDHLRGEISFTQGYQASGLSLRTYRRHREQVKTDLREQLADYAPQVVKVEGEEVDPVQL